jgi:hypothetical protein
MKFVTYRTGSLKMRIFKNLIVFLLLIIFSSFVISSDNSFKEEGSQTVKVDIDAAIKNRKAVYLSQFVNEIKYIPLELTTSCPISQYFKTEVTTDYIIVRSHQKDPPYLLLFNRRNGKFVSEIGKVGRGPNEYSIPCLGYYNCFDAKIFTNGNATWRLVKTYTIEGELAETFSLPTYDEPTVPGKFRIASIDAFLKKDVFVYYVSNETGFIDKKLIVFSKDGIIKSFPNYQTWGDKSDKQYKSMAWGEKRFYYWDNTLYFKEALNDTLFQVTLSRLIPRLIFKSQKFIPYKKQHNIIGTDDQNNYYLITNISESKSYLFFSFSFEKKQYLGITDKMQFKTIICEKNELQESSLIDDINGFMPLTPKYFTSSNEMICVLNPGDILNWAANNPDRLKKLGPDFSWVKDIAEFSNPVLVIGKCK